MTAQVHEKLILNGEETGMNFCPPIIDSPEVIQELPYEEFCEGCANGKIPGIVHSTACWRNYIGTWEIKEGKFYLKKLVGCIKMAKEDSILADWFSSVIRIPQGEELYYVHMGFGTLYERELHIKIEEGVVVDQRTIDNHERAEKIKSASPESRIMEGFMNMPGMDNRFIGDDL